MRQWVGSALVQIMACRLFGAKALSKPTLGHHQLEHYERTSMKMSKCKKIFIHENASENIVHEIAAILSRGRWVECYNIQTAWYYIPCNYLPSINWIFFLFEGLSMLTFASIVGWSPHPTHLNIKRTLSCWQSITRCWHKPSIIFVYRHVTYDINLEGNLNDRIPRNNPQENISWITVSVIERFGWKAIRPVCIAVTYDEHKVI